MTHPKGNSPMRGQDGILVGKLKLWGKPLKARRPIWAWLRLYLTPERDKAKTDY